jgi:glycerate-2-kinase
MSKVRDDLTPIYTAAITAVDPAEAIKEHLQRKGERLQLYSGGSLLYIEGLPDITIASVSADGTDGPTDFAVAVVDGFTLFRAKEKDMDIREYIKRND